jgi:hypothetical protein
VADGDRGVLVAGVYLNEQENRAASIIQELSQSKHWLVDQRWISLGRAGVPAALAAATVAAVEVLEPKFVLLNRLLREIDLERYAFVLVSDDDISLPAGFLDRYLDLVGRHDLALAQPARTHASYIDHFIVEQLDGLDARRTRFVEIGPLFSMCRDAVRHLVPFDEGSPMGWGYDFVWPVVIEDLGLRMGIVDATPVAHDLRKPVAHYDHGSTSRSMEEFLARRQHLSPAQAFCIVEAFS